MFGITKRELDFRYWLVFAIVPLSTSTREKRVILSCCHLPQVGVRPLMLSLGRVSAWQDQPYSADQWVTVVL
jgi:hypothetical protein